MPLDQNHSLRKFKSAILSNSDSSTYKSLVGRLIYLTVTRPDLAYSIQVLSQFLAAPRYDYLQAAFKVVKYLKSNPGQGVLMSASTSATLTAYRDSDWGGCQTSRQSLTGYCV